MITGVREGDLLAGKYRVERVLGEGGMGIVVAARHVSLDERVALKFLLPATLAQPEAVARFLREARASARIKSEHVAHVTDVGVLEGGAPYMVMEFLEGMDLSTLLRERGPLPIEDAVDYVAQTCEAIAEAHALGIIHRDLKPANLMLVRRSDGTPCIKVLDFGISKVSGGSADGMAMTSTSAMLGSPLYMSPEQMMSSRDVDARTDIWSIGTILYELLAGRLPFEAETLPALGVLIATASAHPLGACRTDLAPGLEAIVARCLAKRREDRFASVALLAQALEPFAPDRSRVSIERASRILGERGSVSRPSGPEPRGRDLGASSPNATNANWGQSARRDLRRGKSAAATFAVLAVLIAGVLGALVWLRTVGSAASARVAHPVDSIDPRPAVTQAPEGLVRSAARMDPVAPPPPAEKVTTEIPSPSSKPVGATTSGKAVPPTMTSARPRPEAARPAEPAKPVPVAPVASTPAAPSHAPSPPKADYDQM
jgi:eukaryotic-like serine/threonine-protein kinase